MCKGGFNMLKIDKNCWIIYNKNGALVTIEVRNRDIDKNFNKLKGYNRISILDDEFDNSDYVLLWDVWDNKSHMTNSQIKQNIDKKLSVKDYLTLKQKTSIFNREVKAFVVVGGQLLEHSDNEEIINLSYKTICSHFDKNSKCWQFCYQPSGLTYCTREQAKQVLKTFEQMENSQNIEDENSL